MALSPEELLQSRPDSAEASLDCVQVALVSAAAGAVGLVVGQLLKNVYGCTVIGSAGTDDKVRGGLATA